MPINLHISPDGAIKTLNEAVAKLRGHESEDVNIIIHTGTYRLTEPVKFTASDIGRRTGKLSITSCDGPVRIMGGAVITSIEPLRDEDVKRRLYPEVRDKVVKLDLAEAGITDLGEILSTGFGRPDQVAACELFCDDIPMTLAQYPDKDEFLLISGSPSGKLEDGFNYDSAVPDGWQDDGDIWVHGYWGWDWANSFEKIDIFDKKSRFIKAVPPYGLYEYKTGQRFYFLNVLEELNKPGEYYMDRARGCAYFYPPENATEITASQLKEPLVSFEGIDNIRISGITFEVGRSHGLQFTDCSNLKVSGCTCKNTGEWGMRVIGGKDIELSGNDIYNNGCGGIHIDSGDRFKLEPANVLIASNDIHHFSRITRCYRGGINAYGVGIVIRNNLIHDAPHSAIFYIANDLLIRDNEIYSVCMETGDCGAIYSGRDFSVMGIDVSRNYIHHMGGIGVGSSGVYSDDCLSFTEIYDNFFMHTTNSVNSNGGYKINVRNNVFAFSEPAVLASATGVHPSEHIRNMMDEYMKGLLFEKNPAQPPYSTHYPQLAEILELYDTTKHPTMMMPALIYFRDNVMFGSDFIKRHWTVKDDMIINERTYEAAATDFNDIEFSDITLADGSKAYDSGYTRFDATRIGLDPAERSAPPVKVFTALVKDGPDLIVKAKNKGTAETEFDIALFDMKNIALRGAGSKLRFRLKPGEAAQQIAILDDFDGRETIEARSMTSGVRPSRLLHN